MFTASRRSSLAKLKDLVLSSKPVVQVTLTDDQKDAFVPQYTSLDEIKGEVSITASCDTSFDDIYITFEGSTRTFVEKVASTSPTTGRTDAFHQFLRLVEPISPSAFPNSKVIEAGKVYKFPFTFVVPESLLPQACTHAKKPGFPEGGHLKLPTSLGDAMVASNGKSLMDDMAPDMGTIAYSLRCRISSGRGAGGKYRIMAEGSKKLRIIPATEEQPPLDVNIGGDDRYDYKMRGERKIKKGTFQKRLGRLVVQAKQPQSLKLPYFKGPNADCSPITMATMNLRFDPVEESSPLPSLNTCTARLKVATCFTSIPMDEIPTKSSDYHTSNVRGIFVEAVNLSSLSLSNVEWEKRLSSIDLTDPQNSEIPGPSEGWIGGAFYTAKVAVPISLPKGNKLLVPSFHSCLLSRIYAVDLNLTVSTPSTTIIDPQVHLKLPIQVSSEGNPNATPRISEQEQAAIAAREANAYWDPRSVASPAPQYTEHASQDTPSRARAGIMGNNEGRRVRAQQRFQSLSFEDEEAVLAPPPPPPDYARTGGGSRQGIVSNATSPPASPRSI